MMFMNERRRRLVGGIYDYVRGLVDWSIQNEWKIVIWGFGYGGKFLRHLIESVDGRAKVSYIIDEKLGSSYDATPAIYRSTLLNYIDSSKHIMLSTIKNMEQIEGALTSYDYKLGENLFDVYGDIGDSYVAFLDKNMAVDFRGIAKGEMDDFGPECNNYVPFSQSCADYIFEEILKLADDLSFFDFGCGKGAAILMAYMSGINKLGGVEISESIYGQCVANMENLGISCELLNEDATKCNIDGYNCFFLYNPFGGSVFQKVLSNIRESFRNNRRKIYLVYGNPFMHRHVVEDGFFRLHKQIRTDLYDPLLNIYVTADI